MRRAAITAAIASSVAWAVFAPAFAQAAEGGLDPSFGTGGTVTTPVGPADAFAQSVAVDAQGRIVVAGAASNGSNEDFAVLRYNPDGTLDPTFDGDGVRLVDFLGHRDSALDIAIDSQGRIVVVGQANDGATNPPFGNTVLALARLNQDGGLDPSFDGDGRQTATLGYSDAAATAVTIDAQGKVVVGGYSLVGGDYDFVALRFNDDGSPDASFDGDGKATVDFTAVGGDDDRATAMAIDAQGRIVLAGTSNADSGIARLNPDGSHDTSLAPRAALTVPLGSGVDSTSALAIDSQGRYVIAGSIAIGTNDGDFALGRINPSGSFDSSFDGDGKVTTSIGPYGDGAVGLGLDRQGRIVAAGYSTDNNNFPPPFRVAVIRYNPNGSLDPSFGAGGRVTTQIRTSSLAAAVTIDGHDRLVLAGASNNGSFGDFALARYIGDAVAPAASVDSGPDDGSYTNNRSPSFTFSSSEAGSSFSCGFDGLSAACTSPFAPPAALGDGPHTFNLTATDRAGNTSAAVTRRFTVDATAPTLAIKGKRKVRTRKKKARAHLKLKTSEPVTLACKLDKKKAKPCAAKYNPKLKRGKHKVKVTATDQAGNSSSKTKKLKVVRKR